MPEPSCRLGTTSWWLPSATRIVEPGMAVSTLFPSAAFRVKVKPGHAWSHSLPRRSFGAMVKVVSPAAVVFTGASALCVEGAPRWPETWKVSLSVLLLSSVRRTTAVQLVGVPVAKSRSFWPGSNRKTRVSCSIRANVPLWPWGTLRKELQLAPTSTW